ARARRTDLAAEDRPGEGVRPDVAAGSGGARVRGDGPPRGDQGAAAAVAAGTRAHHTDGGDMGLEGPPATLDHDPVPRPTSSATSKTGPSARGSRGSARGCGRGTRAARTARSRRRWTPPRAGTAVRRGRGCGGTARRSAATPGRDRGLRERCTPR